MSDPILTIDCRPEGQRGGALTSDMDASRSVVNKRHHASKAVGGVPITTSGTRGGSALICLAVAIA